MAIFATHTCAMHAAAHERDDFIIFIAHLPVRIIDVRLIRNSKTKVIEEICARFEFAVEFCPARVAGCAS